MSDRKVALITGASRGIGRAIALQLAQDGYYVIVNYCGSVQAAQEVVAQIEADGHAGEALQCDVADFAACQEMMADIHKRLGSIDVLVNNAGITRDGLLMAMKEEDFDAVLATNLKGTFHCIRFASKYMLKQRSGKIINMSSISGVIGNAGQANYSASKAGVIGLTKSAARELASRSITVNAIAPGFIETDMTNQLSDKIKDEMGKQIPLKRIGQPEEVASLVSFLASDRADYITGQVIQIDGGMGI